MLTVKWCVYESSKQLQYLQKYKYYILYIDLLMGKFHVFWQNKNNTPEWKQLYNTVQQRQNLGSVQVNLMNFELCFLESIIVVTFTLNMYYLF